MKVTNNKSHKVKYKDRYNGMQKGWKACGACDAIGKGISSATCDFG